MMRMNGIMVFDPPKLQETTRCKMVKSKIAKYFTILDFTIIPFCHLPYPSHFMKNLRRFSLPV